jgi:CRISPR/Cas system endoribonuclease Cas6 (RAMP superfamily)
MASSLTHTPDPCTLLHQAFLHWFTREGMEAEELIHAATVLEEAVHQVHYFVVIVIQ